MGGTLVRAFVWSLTINVVLVATTALPATAQPSATTPAVTAEEVSFRSGEVTLHGTVLSPSAATGRRPGMVLVHGSGTGVSRENLRREAEAFAAGGVVSLIYDKRAAGYSLVHRDYSLLADDALAGAALLRTRADVDPGMVGLWGLSEGGWVVPMAAARSTDVAFLVVVGANGVAPARQQAWALGEQQHHLGITGPAESAFTTTATRLIVGAGLFAQADHDPVPVLENVHQPVLAIWGSKDRLTPPGEALTIFRQTLGGNGNPHYTLRVFANGDHAIHESTDDGFHRLGDLMPGYADLVTSWVTAVAAGRAPDSSADAAPHQDRLSPVIRPLGWWQSPWLQLVALVVFLLAFLGYPLAALAGRLRRRRIAGVPSAPWLAGSGLAVVLGFLVYFMLASAAPSMGPVIFGRALVWLVLQALAVTVVATAVVTAIAWRRGRAELDRTARTRLGLLLAGASVFTVWAVYWGLLLP